MESREQRAGSAQGPVVLVTGATDGIGRQTALELVRRGVGVLVHGRNTQRLEQVCRELEAEGRGRVLDPLRADLSRLGEVRALVAELEQRQVEVDVLVNNAGVYMRERQETAEGYEMTMGVNHDAPFLLTHLLLAGPSGSTLRRIINVSSIAHQRGRLDLEDLDFKRRGFDGYTVYAASKLANVLFTVELARRLVGQRVTVNALHPGVVSTKLLTEGFGVQGRDSLEEGSATSVKLAVDPELEGVTGRYFMAGREAQMNPAAGDRELARRFYELSARRVGVEPLPG
jgi:retinol dehydrogenase 14